MPNRVFLAWLCAVLLPWAALASHWLTWDFVRAHAYYPLTMVLGAFVAGSTPQGGGAVAFPVLSVIFEVDRALARDFSMMVQSVGMTSASIFLLTQPNARGRYRQLCWWLPVAALGFVTGMLLLQDLRVPLIQSLFLGTTCAFAIAYLRSDHRGSESDVRMRRPRDTALLVATLFVGGLATSLFGTGADILLFTLLVTWFAMKERAATEMSIVVMAALSLLGFAWRGAVEGSLTTFQLRTWLTAVPVVLIMAPLGTFVLTRISAERLLRVIVLLNLAQLGWFNLHAPSLEKTSWSLGCGAVALAGFSWGMLRLARRRRGAVLGA